MCFYQERNLLLSNSRVISRHTLIHLLWLVFPALINRPSVFVCGHPKSIWADDNNFSISTVTITNWFDIGWSERNSASVPCESECCEKGLYNENGSCGTNPSSQVLGACLRRNGREHLPRHQSPSTSQASHSVGRWESAAQNNVYFVTSEFLRGLQSGKFDESFIECKMGWALVE